MCGHVVSISQEYDPDISKIFKRNKIYKKASHVLMVLFHQQQRILCNICIINGSSNHVWIQSMNILIACCCVKFAKLIFLKNPKTLGHNIQNTKMKCILDFRTLCFGW